MFSLPYFVHIGFPRTGSTWLQRLFYDHPEICFIFRPQYYGWEDNWQKGKEFYKNLFKINEKHKIILDSDESYSIGRRYGFTGFKSKELKWVMIERIRQYILPSDMNFIAQRIYTTNPKTKIIMVLRRQPEWLLSSYRRFVGTEGQKWKFNDFIKANYAGQEFFNAGFYAKTVKLYFDLFGRENVLVLFYENLEKNKNSFLKQISDFLNISEFNSLHINAKVRVSMSNRAVKLMQKANYITQLLPHKRNALYYKFIFRLVRKLNKILLIKIKDATILSGQEKSELLENYKQDNRKLARILNQDLKKWGYY